MIIDDLRLVIKFTVHFVERLPSDLVDGKLFTNECSFSSSLVLRHKSYYYLFIWIPTSYFPARNFLVKGINYREKISWCKKTHVGKKLRREKILILCMS